jgi:hypothetical protein
MMRPRTSHILLAALMLVVLLLPSAAMPVSAGHCDELEQRVARLNAEAQELERELRDAEIELDRKQRTLENFLDAWTDDAAFLAEGTLADEAMLEAVQVLGAEFTVEMLPAILVSLFAPEFLSTTSVVIIEFLDTAYSMADMAIDVNQMMTIINELFALPEGSSAAFAEAHQYAQQEGMQKLDQLISLVERLSDMSGVQQAYDDWFNAGINVESLAGALEVKRAELQAAAEALDRCVQEDISPLGLWLNEDGETVEIVIEEGSGVMSAIYRSNEDGVCPTFGNRRPQYLQGPYAEGAWSGTMWRCTEFTELMTECGLSEVFERPFEATFEGDTIRGTYLDEWYSYVENPNPGGCEWVRDPSGDSDISFSLTRVDYGTTEE